MNFLKRLRARIILKRAIRLADEAYLQSPHRWYVMATTDGKLCVLDRKNFRILKRKHYIAAGVTCFDLLRECFYFTPLRNGTGAITHEEREQKLLQYFSWKKNF